MATWINAPKDGTCCDCQPQVCDPCGTSCSDLQLQFVSATGWPVIYSVLGIAITEDPDLNTFMQFDPWSEISGLGLEDAEIYVNENYPLLNTVVTEGALVVLAFYWETQTIACEGMEYCVCVLHYSAYSYDTYGIGAVTNAIAFISPEISGIVDSGCLSCIAGIMDTDSALLPAFSGCVIQESDSGFLDHSAGVFFRVSGIVQTPSCGCECDPALTFEVERLHGEWSGITVQLTPGCEENLDWETFPYVWDENLNIASNLSAIEALTGFGQWFGYGVSGDNLLLVTMGHGSCVPMLTPEQCEESFDPVGCLSPCNGGGFLTAPAELVNYGISFIEATITDGGCGGGDESCYLHNMDVVTGPFYVAAAGVKMGCGITGDLDFRIV
jgi:hypothetical protein